jgi:hypothetical protein
VVISHTYVEPANRGKLRALANGGSVTAVVPARWSDPTLGRRWDLPTPCDDGGAVLAPAWWIGPHRPPAGVLWVPDRLLRDASAVVQVEEEPWTPTAWLVTRRARGPVFLFTWENIVRQLPPPWSLMRRATLRRVRGLIAGNAAAAEVARHYGYTGAIAVIPQLGVAPTPTEPHTPSAVLRVAYVGRLVPEKGVDIILRAVAALAVPWQLTVLGDGPTRPALERLAGDLALPADTVRFTGARPHSEVAAIWPSVDVLVLPSRTTPNWREQLGHVLLEAMAHGVTVVGSSSGAIPEVIGPAGIVFPEEDHAALAHALGALAADPARRQALAQAGRDRVRAEFTDERLAARTRAFHADVLGIN